MMRCEFVSQNGQMELPVSTNVSFKKGHQCVACHNASDVKVRTEKQFANIEK